MNCLCFNIGVIKCEQFHCVYFCVAIVYWMNTVRLSHRYELIEFELDFEFDIDYM